MIKHITTIEDYWADFKDEFESRDHTFSRFTVDQVKYFNTNIDVEGVEDNAKNMYSNTYLMKLSGTPISSKPYEDSREERDVTMD